MLLALLFACDAAPEAEPLVLPADPAEPGAPVGVRTVGPADAPIEVWYPASDSVADTATDRADFSQFVPEAFIAHVGAFDFPVVDGRAVRDAALREPESPYPLVVFSHGFGGVRLQSLDVVTHLASRGYVVAAVDHPGRSMPDLLPCLFSPALEGCDLSGFSSDPGVAGVIDTLDWLEAAAAGDAVDSEILAAADSRAVTGLVRLLGAGLIAFSDLGHLQLELRAGAVLRDEPTRVALGLPGRPVADVSARQVLRQG
jgi:hypothetical protein